MKISKSAALVVFALLLSRVVLAQEKPAISSILEKLMGAELQPLDGGSPFRLSDYTGKSIVLTVWAAWCDPCRLAAPSFAALHKDYALRGVEVVGLLIDEAEAEKEKERAFVRDAKPDYKLGWLDMEAAKELLAPSASMPQTYVLTDGGVIIKRVLGYNASLTQKELRAAVEQALINLPAKP